MNAPQHEASRAEALDRALTHRRSAAAVVDRELADLVELAQTLELSAAEVTSSAEFRAAARQRLLVQMGRSAGEARSRGDSVGDRVRLWAVRFAAGLTALGFAGAAAAGASASALPGDPLYPLKQATEAVALQLATTDSAREEILLHQADTRLDETAQLLEQGRANDAAATAARYDATLGALATTSSYEAAESNRRTNEVRLDELRQTAPAAARPGLERALAATKRSLNQSRPTVPTATSEVAEVVATPVAEPPQSARPSDAADRETATPQPLRPADADERGVGESHEAPAAAQGRRVENRADTPPADIETAVPSGESHGSTVSENRAAPQSKLQPASTQPGRTPPGRTAVPHSQPGGRGRP